MKRFSTACKKFSVIMMTAALVLLMLPAVQAQAASSYVTSLTLAKTAVTVKAGKSASVAATVKVKGSAAKKVTATSSNKNVATVSVGTPGGTGKSTLTIKGVKKGTATITVKTAAKGSTGKVLSKKITVTVGYADVTGLTVTPTSKTLTVGQSVTLSSTVAPAKANSGVTYTSSNTSVATVSAAGKVTAKAAGTATITVKTKGKNAKGAAVKKTVKITVKKPDGFTSADYSVTTGSEVIHIEFKINTDSVSKQELIEAGYTVVGDVASKDTLCETATYSFKKLPKNLDELKNIKLNTKFGPMAATICALTTFTPGTTSSDMYENKIFDMFDYLSGPNLTISNPAKSGVYYSMKSTLENGKYAYFKGATPFNNYTASTPYTFTLIEGPYYIPAKQTVNGYEPEKRMILISFAGDDSQRYMDVYQSSDGNWYGWDGQWKHMIAGIKPVQTAW